MILNGTYNDVFIFLLLSGERKADENRKRFAKKHRFNACTLVSAEVLIG